MKKLISLLLALALLLPCLAVSGEDEDISIDDVTEEVLLDDTDDSDEESEDEEDGGTLAISEEDQLELEALDDDIDDSVDPDSLELNPNLPDNVLNILLIGVDTRSKEMNTPNKKGGTGERGDVQIILSINRDTGDIKLTSIMRDSFMTIPGYKNKYKINVSYAYGAGKLAMRTVNHNYDMNIQHYVAINFYGLASIIDSIGGIDVDLTKKEATAINAYLKKHAKSISRNYDTKDRSERTALEKKAGVQHLDGLQAVMYARLREIDNDFARTERQRHLLDLLLKSVVKDMSFDKLMDLISACLPYARTNMNAMTMFSLASDVLASGIMEKASAGESLIEQFRVPVSEPKKLWKYGSDNHGASVIIITDRNLKKNTEALHDFIYGNYYPAK